MAIVIKVKADTKELEKDIEQAAQKAKKSIDQVTSSAGGGGRGAAGLEKITQEFKNLRAAGDVLRGRLEAIPQMFKGISTGAGIATASTVALAGAAVAAAGALVSMGKAGSEAAQAMLDLAKKQEISIRTTQQLVINTKDYSERLSTLGGILSDKVVRGAADAFNEFKVLDRQLTATNITIADNLAPGLDALGIALQDVARRAQPVATVFAQDLAEGMKTAARDISATAREFTFIQSIFDLFTVDNVVNELQRLYQAQRAPGNLPPQQQIRDIAPPMPPSPAVRNVLGLTGAATYQLYGRDTRSRTPRAPRARAAQLPVAAREAQQNIEQFSNLTASNLGVGVAEGMFKLREELDKTALETQKFALQFADFRSRGLEKSKEALELLSKWQVAYLHTLNVERELKQQLATTAALPAAQQRNLPLAVGGVSPVTPGTGIPGAAQPIGAFEAFGPIAAQARDASAKIFNEVREQAIRFKEGIVFTFESAFREGFERGPKAFLQATASAIKSFFSQIAAELSTGIIEMILFGKGGMSGRGVGTSGTLGGLGAALGGFGGGGGGGGGGGFLGGLLGNFGGLGGGTFGGSIFGGGAGGAGIGVAPSLSGAIGGFSGFSGGFGGISNAVAQQVGFGGAGAASGGLFGGLLGAVAGPAAIGGLLGTGLGGKSLGGKILGGIGGGIAGIGVGLGAAVGLAGGGLLAGALAATGFGLLALPFIVGAVLLGKAKQRKVDEQAADAIWVAEREQIRTLISAVNADRIEGYDALAQWSTLRSQTVSQLNQIKTTSVRESRLTNQLRDLDNGVVAELRAAVERQARRRGVSGMLVPEFESGGRVPGVDRGYDSVMIKARPGEVVLNRQQQASIQARAGDRIFEEVGIQSFQYGGRVSAAPQVPQSLHLTISLEGDAQAVIGNLIVRGVETSSGQRAIVSVVKNGRKNGEL